MTPIVAIGDELNTLGWRLAGVETRSPTAAELPATLAQALGSAALVLLTRGCADALPAGVLARALRQATPLVVVVPDIRAPESDTAWTRRIRNVLGIAS